MALGLAGYILVMIGVDSLGGKVGWLSASLWRCRGPECDSPAESTPSLAVTLNFVDHLSFVACHHNGGGVLALVAAVGFFQNTD